MSQQERIGALASHSHHPEQEPCGLCDGTGWAQAATASAAFAVVRCRCSEGTRGGTEHPNGCACRTCYYGPERAATIAYGVDGYHRGSAPDPLAKPALPGYTPGAEF